MLISLYGFHAAIIFWIIIWIIAFLAFGGWIIYKQISNEWSKALAIFIEYFSFVIFLIPLIVNFLVYHDHQGSGMFILVYPSLIISFFINLIYLVISFRHKSSNHKIIDFISNHHKGYEIFSCVIIMLSIIVFIIMVCKRGYLIPSTMSSINDMGW